MVIEAALVQSNVARAERQWQFNGPNSDIRLWADGMDAVSDETLSIIGRKFDSRRGDFAIFSSDR